MEVTPQNQVLRPRHTPTPKMSDRKKSLFSSSSSRSSIPQTIDEDNDLGPMSPLQFSSSPTSHDNSHNCDLKSRFLRNAEYRTDFRNVLIQLSPLKTNDISPPLTPSTSKNTQKPKDNLMVTELHSDNEEKENSHKTRTMKTPNESNTNFDMPRKSSRRSVVFDAQATPELHLTPTTKKSRKRAEVNNSNLVEPKPTTNAKTSLQFNEFPAISAKSFYGSSYSETEKMYLPHFSQWIPKETRIEKVKKPTPKARKPKTLNRPILGNVNKGVRHRITKPKTTRQEKLKSMSRSQLLEMATKLIEKSSLTEYFAKLKAIKADSNKVVDDTKITPDQIARLKRVLRERQHTFDTGRPLNWNIHGTPSDCLNDADSAEEVEQVEDCDQVQNENAGTEKRKFFKSNRSTTKGTYKLTDRLSATVKRGATLVLQSPKKKKTKNFDASYDEFLLIQNEVNDIVDMLEIHMEQSQEILLNKSLENVESNMTPIETPKQSQPQQVDTQVDKDEQYAEFRRQILNLTDDPKLREKHENQLDFLISYNICTEENFRIFILEPDQHWAEIEKILNELIVVDDTIDEFTMQNETMGFVNSTFANTTCTTQAMAEATEPMNYPMSPTSQISCMTSELALDCADQNNPDPNTNKDKLYPIFYQQNQNEKTDSNGERSGDQQKEQWKSIGNNQMIIDAGQREFGPKICQVCGMFYTTHDPDDERLHEQYHSQRHDLTFRGWSDENVVQEVTDWGVDGRIINVTRHDARFKRHRIDSLLNGIVNSELGCNTVVWNTLTMVFLAISKKQIIGICVVEPVKEANTITEENGVPLVNLNEKVSVKCGISRIWTARPYRRSGIATALINSVRSRYIPNYIILTDEIAFSSPTEDGIKFAKKISEQVLVYDAI